MVETIHTPKSVSTIAGDITMIDSTNDTAIDSPDDTVSEAEGPSITASCDYLFWR
jgi:hypothetical protein